MPLAHDPNKQRPESPCIGICTLDDEDQCIGCHRSLDEIAGWEDLDAQAQWDLLGELSQRAKSPTAKGDDKLVDSLLGQE